MIINNVSVVQHQPSYTRVVKKTTRKNAQSHKRFASNPVRRDLKSKAVSRKTTDIVSRISEKEMMMSAQSQDRGKFKRNQN